MPADHPNIDLHSHTTRSDGTLSPTALVQRARANGVDMLALTDHDVLDGLPEAQAAARAEGLVLIPGVEVSITWAGETIHIVGLRVDPQDATLLAGLEANRAGRTERAREMAAELERCGVPDAWEGALKYVGNPALISRSHFGRHLVALGLCASQREVFDHWLVEGKPGFVPQRWASLADAVGWIRGAGGTAVLAHPGRYQRLDETRLWALAEDFVAAGGEAIEVVAGGHGPEEIARFARWAKRLGIRASRGSDFHDPLESRFDVGLAPPLPPGLVPVWTDWPEVQGP